MPTIFLLPKTPIPLFLFQYFEMDFDSFDSNLISIAFDIKRRNYKWSFEFFLSLLDWKFFFLCYWVILALKEFHCFGIGILLYHRTRIDIVCSKLAALLEIKQEKLFEVGKNLNFKMAKIQNLKKPLKTQHH